MQHIMIDLEMNKIEKKYGIIKQIFYLFPNSEIIGIDCNKRNDEQDKPEICRP